MDEKCIMSGMVCNEYGFQFLELSENLGQNKFTLKSGTSCLSEIVFARGCEILSNCSSSDGISY